MILLLLHLLRLLPFLFGGHRQLALENVALRHQLAVYKRTVTRPRLCRTDRFFWITLARVWPGWRQPLAIVTPDTILRWQRRLPPSQTWRTFLANRVPDLASIDFFAVPSARLRVLFVLVMLAHYRRR